MSVVELQELEEIKGLVAKGQLFGVLTHGEIATAVAELDLDVGDVADQPTGAEAGHTSSIVTPEMRSAISTASRTATSLASMSVT